MVGLAGAKQGGCPAVVGLAVVMLAFRVSSTPPPTEQAGVTRVHPSAGCTCPELSVHGADWAPYSVFKQQRISTFNTTSVPEHRDLRETLFLERSTDSGSFGG